MGEPGALRWVDFPRMMERLLNVVDPVGLGRASARAMTRTAVRPGAVMGPTARFAGGVVQASVVTACRMMGVDVGRPDDAGGQGQPVR